ncbi:MAG: glycoside hydrolase 100 family protein [Gammaproteobacteria bacterium]|nr:glycoside hydrolase 100 family protein [Gammaproteobacteria bacterium]MDH5803032.1 glycoside hydrolase 100 family protein [Gammaproteobacteria bacterium]
MSTDSAIQSAYDVLNRSILYFREQPVGTAAAVDNTVEAVNYEECFIRDFVPSAMVFLMDGNTDIVRNFLQMVVRLQAQQTVMEGHERAMGLMPASFRTPKEGEPSADFGDRAIGRVAPVDSAMWWMLLLRSYVVVTGDIALAHSPEFQESMRQTLQLYLKESFEQSPGMLVPDASFMIDRRMGVYGHPLEIQSLFYGMLHTAQELLLATPETQTLLNNVSKRLKTLRSYVRIYYWLDRQRLNEIHRFRSEEFGVDAVNLFNIYPETIPEWIDGWVPEHSGYFVGNLGPGRMDFRFFAFGNLLAVMFGLATDEQSVQLMDLYRHRWDDLVGQMPLKILYPAVSGEKWAYTTGSDPKNVPWSYHNGGHWPCLIWAFAGAAIRTGHHDLAQKMLQTAKEKLPRDNWPEYYDGQKGTLIGRRANYFQTWSACGVIVAERFLNDSESLPVFESFIF